VQGLNDVQGAVVQGAQEVSKRIGKSALKGGQKKSASATEKASADPAVFFDREQQKAMQDLGTANILISGQTGVGKSTLINVGPASSGCRGGHRQAGYRARQALPQGGGPGHHP
jgi:hypothetical protein